jgi:hypothetical protein
LYEQLKYHLPLIVSLMASAEKANTINKENISSVDLEKNVD